jgi:phosphoglycerate dehydrogenase-like enzyme
MVRVGVQDKVPEKLLRSFPDGVEVVRLPAEPKSEYEIDFWVLPFGKKAAMAQLPHLRGVKVVQTITAGVDSILPWLPEGLTLCDGRGIHDISTAEWVVAVLLAEYKRLPLYRDLQRSQEWKGQALGAIFTDDAETSNGLYRILSEDLYGRRVLIVGYGSIGAAIEARLAPFGVEIVRVARSAKSVPDVKAIDELDSLLPDADAVVLIVPLTDETNGFFDEARIAKMKRGALLVNAARGPVVVTDALVPALNEGRIRAAVDVTDPEPLPKGHPMWSAKNLLLTPHVAGSTPEFIERAFRFVGEQLGRYLRGEELENRVSSAGY